MNLLESKAELKIKIEQIIAQGKNGFHNIFKTSYYIRH